MDIIDVTNGVEPGTAAGRRHPRRRRPAAGGRHAAVRRALLRRGRGRRDGDDHRHPHRRQRRGGLGPLRHRRRHGRRRRLHRRLGHAELGRRRRLRQDLHRRPPRRRAVRAPRDGPPGPQRPLRRRRARDRADAVLTIIDDDPPTAGFPGLTTFFPRPQYPHRIELTSLEGDSSSQNYILTKEEFNRAGTDFDFRGHVFGPPGLTFPHGTDITVQILNASDEVISNGSTFSVNGNEVVFRRHGPQESAGPTPDPSRRPARLFATVDRQRDDVHDVTGSRSSWKTRSGRPSRR